MKQNLIATLISTALVIAPLPAFTADSSVATPKTAQASGPLAASKPAGVQQAQGNNGVEDEDLLFGAGVATAVGLGAWALTNNNNNNNGGGTTPAPTPSPTTTTTTP